MIDLIVGIFCGVKNLLYYGLLLSYEIGKIVVKLVQVSWFILRYLYDICQIVTTVICEDFVIFLYDLYEHIVCIAHILSNTFGNIHYCAHAVIVNVKYYLSSGKDIVWVLFHNILHGNLKVLSIIGQLFVGIKQLFVLLGSGVWFLLTLIPLSIIYSFSLCTYYVGSCIEELVDLMCMVFKPLVKFIQDIIDFTFDVPFEATAGLIAGSCILYLIIKFHMLAYTFLKDQFILSAQHLRYLIRNQLPQRRARIQRTIIIPQSTPSPDTSRNRDTVCVICQEREKCILILPCKHMCLCSECKDELYRYHSRCPICRSYVHRTMKVFI